MQFWGESKMPLDINGQGSISGITSLNTVVSDAELERLDGVTSAIQTQLNDKLPIAGGKILQVVRATDGTQRTTTSTSFVDASISATITPQKSDSAILLVWSALLVPASNAFVVIRITDSSDNLISNGEFGGDSLGTGSSTVTIFGYVTPNTPSAVTYKGRFRTTSGTGTIANQNGLGQFYAIEVSA